MCGKFTQMMAWREVVAFSDFLKGDADGEIETVTPMRFARVLRRNPETGLRENLAMRWGWARRNATAPMQRPEHIHARAESIDEKATFREAFRDRRGLLVVHTFNEGEEVGKKTIQHTISPRDGRPVGIAVLWEEWVHPNEANLVTFVMVTVPANRLISAITDRMPAIVQPDDWARWLLGETDATPAELKAMLTPYDGDWDMQPERKAAAAKAEGAALTE